MIEKHGDSEVKVKWNDSRTLLIMQLPNHDNWQEYDGRFGDLSGLNEPRFFPEN